MRRHLLALLVCVLLCLMVLPGTASADSGPKPAVTITVVNAPAGEYYLDLLVTDPGDHANIDPADYDPNLLQGLRDWEVDGWYPALAGGTSVPLFGDLRPGEDGTIVLPTTACLAPFVSPSPAQTGPGHGRALYPHGVLHPSDVRLGDQLHYKGHLPGGVLRRPVFIHPGAHPAGGGWAAVAVRLPSRRDWLVFLAVNLVTQAGLHLWIAADLVSIGDSALQYLVLLVAEVPILLVELIAYVFLLKEYSGLRRAAYAACANIASYAVGYLPLHWAVEFLAR